MSKVYTDRSRIIQHQRCPRSRFLAYHESGMGLSSVQMPLPLAVGLSVHVGLATMLQCYLDVRDSYKSIQELLNSGVLRAFENDAVRAALADFAQYSSVLDVDTTEAQAMIAIPADFASPETVAEAERIVGESKSRFDSYLAKEQSALVEAMVRAYARRRLRLLLEQYEVLEIEREGTWQLYEGFMEEGEGDHGQHYQIGPYSLWFMSRPDALLLERDTRQLYLLSYKTTSSWDIRKARDAEHDMQGLSEGIEVERRLAEWWEMTQRGNLHFELNEAQVPPSMVRFLSTLPAPPRILGVRYEYLLKGDRWKDKELSARLGIEARSQRSHLIRGYLNQGMASGDEQWNWSWDYHKDDGTASKLYYKSWQSTPVWEHMPIVRWIDMLDSAAMAQVADADSVGQDVRELGYKCDAQATGFTSAHPLDEVFVPPVIVYRNEDDLRDLVEQIEAQERRVAEGVEQVRAATDEGERRHQMNVHFPQTRTSCEFPSTCAFVKICYAGEDMRRDPLSSGYYKLREPNHPQERGQ